MVFVPVKDSNGENYAEVENAEAEEYFELLKRCKWGFDLKEAEAKIDKRGGSRIVIAS